MGLDAGRQQLGAGHQVLARLAAAALDAAGDGLDARAQQVLELRDAGVDVAGDDADAALDALLDVGVDFGWCQTRFRLLPKPKAEKKPRKVAAPKEKETVR